MKQEHHKKIKRKKVIVMAINIGYDTTTSQFDVMIPGEELYIITDVIVS